MKTFLYLAVAYFVGSTFYAFLMADSKAEAVLRAKLAVQEQALARSTKEKAALAASVAKLSKVTASTAANQEAATSSAQENASVSQSIAAENGVIARQAATSAELAAAAAKAQALTTTIIQGFGFAALLVGLLFNAYSDNRRRKEDREDAARDRQWAKEDASKKHDVVVEKIAEVKNEAKAAYREANDVNNKIAAAGMKLNN